VLLADAILLLCLAPAKRRRQFAAGRLCARSALATFGVSDFPLLVGDDRFPSWPAEAIGSITHAEGFVGAAVAARSVVADIVIDVESRGRVQPRLWKRICRESEIRWLRTLPEARQMEMATVIFSAKEAFYKCQYCLSRSWLGFHDVALEIEDGAFEVELLKPVPQLAGYASALGGRFEIEADLVATGISLPPR
jgi:4'-phosphopantetheinyl transferase EntD